MTDKNDLTPADVARIRARTRVGLERANLEGSHVTIREALGHDLPRVLAALERADGILSRLVAAIDDAAFNGCGSWSLVHEVMVESDHHIDTDRSRVIGRISRDKDTAIVAAVVARAAAAEAVAEERRERAKRAELRAEAAEAALAIEREGHLAKQSLLEAARILLAAERAKVAELQALVDAADMFRFGRFTACEDSGRWYVVETMADGDADWRLDAPMSREEAIGASKAARALAEGKGE